MASELNLLDELYRCPNCGHVAPLESYDVLGAPEGTLWCNWCNKAVRVEKAVDDE